MRVLTGRCVFEKGPDAVRIDMALLRYSVASAWGFPPDMVVLYADRVVLVPGTPFIEWRVFDASDRLYTDWLIYDMKDRPGHGERVSEVLGYFSKALNAGRVIFDDDDVPLHSNISTPSMSPQA